MAAARKIPFSNGQVHAGTWRMPAVVPIHRLRGLVLGLVGFGRIPQLVAPKAKPCGLTVVAYDPFAPADVFARAGVERVDFALSSTRHAARSSTKARWRRRSTPGRLRARRWTS